MMIIGIDPGISGSICFFQAGIIKDVIEMPTMTDGKKNKRQVNGAQIFNVKQNLEKIIVNFISTEIEWIPLNSVDVNEDNKDSIVDFLETLEEDDDVQNVYSNVNLGGI